MATLLLRLAGPMQSWGISSRFGYRETELEPSKSGVIGLLCAALGVPREDDETVGRLAARPMGVRVNREGAIASDFQTVGSGRVAGQPYGVARADGSHGAIVLSRRDYLAGADFLVGLEDEDDGWLEHLDRAVRTPAWPLYLGRRAHVPAISPALGVVGGDLVTSLAEAPYPLTETPPPGGLRMILETLQPHGYPRYDVPVSFAHERRRFRMRLVTITYLPSEQIRTPQ
jgi:CRISPR system Cascade subunit CasD